MKNKFLKFGMLLTLLCNVGCSKESSSSYISSNNNNSSTNKLSFSDLPTFNITTNGIKIPSKDDENYKDYAAVEIDYNYDDESFIDLEAKIRIRGTSSRWFDKKGYKIKFSTKKSLIKSTKNKKYNLLASYMDPCKLRDYLALSISYNMNINSNRYAPKPTLATLNIDKKNYGLYLLTDDIEANEGRIPLDEYNASDIKVPFILEMDTVAYKEGKEDIDYFALGTTEVFKYDGNEYADLLYVYDTPEDLNEEQRKYIKDYISECRQCLVDKDIASFAELVDLDAFIDYWLLGELFRNTDMAGRSVYMYKQNAESKLIFGPSWDFDYSCSRPYQLGPNTDYSLDNAKDRFTNYDWWSLFLNIEESSKYICNRYKAYLRKIYLEEIENAKKYYYKYEELIKTDASIWYSEKINDTNKLVDDNFKWTCNYFELRMEMMDSLFNK